MAELLLAWDPASARPVVLKVQRPTADAGTVEREGRLLAALLHPGLPAVYGRGTLLDGRPFFAMPHLGGITLLVYAARPHPLSKRVRMLMRVADIIGFAH